MSSSRLRATAKPFAPKWGPPQKSGGKRGQKDAKRKEAERKAADERKRQEEEKQRQEEERRKQEEARKAEEERKRQEEEKRRAEEERRRQEEEERRRKEEEDRRLAEEARKAEEERLRKEAEEKEEEEKEEEERRKQAEQAEQGRKYDKAFLMTFQELFRDPPAGLASKFLNMGNKKKTQGGRDRGGRDRRDFGGRNNRQGGKQTNHGHGGGGRRDRGGGRRGGGRGGGRRGNKQDAPMDIEIKALEMSENRYTRQTEVPPDQKLLRSINSLLNKLTPEKFEKLTKQFMDLGIDTFPKLRDLVQAVFEKALAEPNFCPTYARFCKEMHRALPAFDTGEEGGKKQNFKRLLLNQCQREFEKDGAIDLAKAAELETEEERDAYMLKAKQRRLGTTRFIGELFLHGMVAMRIVEFAFNYLLEPITSPDEQNIETLCKLLMTIGETLQQRERKLPPKQRKGPITMNALRSLIDNQRITNSRIRFLVMDTVELSQNGWVQRLQKLSAKKLSEIHKEDQNKKERDRENERRRIKDDRRRNFESRFLPQQPRVNKTYHSNTRRQDRNNRDADGWESGGGRNNRRNKTGDVRAEKRQGGHGNRNGGRYQKPKSPKQKPVVRASFFNNLELDEPEEDDEEDEVPEEVQSPVENKVLSAEERKSKVNAIKSLIKEYFMAVDVKEAKMCVDELGTNQLNHALVFEGMMLSLEKKEREQGLLRDLFKFFVTNNILNTEQITMGFNEMMEWGNDIAPDYPLMFDILGKFLATFITHTPATMKLAYVLSEPVTQLDVKRYRPKFVVGTLKAVKVVKGEAGLKSMIGKISGFASKLSTAGVTAEMLTAAGLDGLA